MNDVLKLLQDKDFDPIEKMRLLAEGNAVALELMTQEEYDVEEVLDTDGLIETDSGHSVALKLIPVKLRAEMCKELAKYGYAQKKMVDGEDFSDEKEAKVVVYIPANDRDKPDKGPKKKKIIVRKKGKKK